MKKKKEVKKKTNRKRMILPIIIFSLLILAVSLVANTSGLNDVGDYLGVAKGLSGDFVTKMRSTHSWVYGAFLSLPLMVVSSLATIKLFNVIWLISIGIALYNITKNKRTFLLYAFSPAVWYMAPWISPVLPSAFFLLLSYYFIKKYEILKENKQLIYAGAFLGLTTLLWDPMIFVAAFFILSFFYNKEVKELIWFTVPALILASVRLLLDWYLFGFPLFSLFRSMGSIVLAGLKLGAYNTISYSIWAYVLMFVTISPLFILFIYKFIKKEYKPHLPELAFMALTFIFFLTNPQIRYLIILAPIFFVLVAPYITKKEFYWHLLTSLVLIILLLTACFGLCSSTHVISYFEQTQESLMAEDINQIAKDFPNQTFLAGNRENTDLYSIISLGYWGSNIKEIISWQDYELWKNNKTNFQEYRIESDSRVNNIRKVWLEFGVARTDNRTFEDIKYLISDKDSTELQDFTLTKTYNLLSVFEKTK